ncbi:MAG TPA: homocysteine S-methyltransferase family protein [Anaerolineaceae bacterium]|nr:homocysteine S-methyltransferase family protein [Anaerolineaceae bacterium]
MNTASRFRQAIQAGDCLVSDGATGTNLQKRGLPPGRPSDVWVLEKPEEIVRLHRDFIDAGANIILTDSFSGTTVNLARSGLAERARELNQRAVALARQAVDGRPVYVAGSMGPLGEMLKPFGTLEEAAAESTYAEQAAALAEAGVDLLVIETQFDLTEAKAAVRAVRSVTDLPLVCSFSFDRGVRSMMGVRPAQFAEAVGPLGVDLVGINCGRSLDDNLKALGELRQACDLPIWFKPNAGLPHVNDDGESIYDVTPESMGAQVAAWIAAGARVVGGCCGTSPAHVRQIASALAAAAGRA